MSDAASVISATTGISASSAAIGEGTTETATTNTLPHLTREWMRLESEIATLSAEMKARRRRVKETRAMILQIMRTGEVARLGISSGYIVREEKTSKAAVSKKYLNSTLLEFFGGDATRARACVEWIESHRPVKVSENLTLQPKDA